MARREREILPSSQHGNYVLFMRLCKECERLQVSYIEAANQLAIVQQRLACYRPSRDTEFPGLWAGSMDALTTTQTVRDQMLWHFGLHITSAKVAAAS